MSAERKKLLWISISACVFVLLVLAVGFVLLAPKKGAAQAPAAIGNSAPPKAQDPQDYLSAPPTSPSLEQPKSQDGDVIVVYGDKPSLPAAAAPAEGSATAAPGQGEPTSSGTGLSAGSTPASDSGSAADKGATPAAKSPATGKASASSAAAGGAAAQSGGAKKGAAAKQSAPAAKTAAKSAPVRVDEYWIQAGSFTSRGRADELKQGLAEKGMASLIAVKEISGKSYYRVRIGPYSSETEAKGWLEKIKVLEGCSGAQVWKTPKKTK